MNHETKYDPNALIDFLIINLKLKNDAALADRLGVAPPVISKVRFFKIPLGPSLMVRIHEETDINVKELRAVMGDFRPIYSSRGLLL